MALESGNGLISKANGHVTRPVYLVLGKQQIEVALPAMLWIIDEVRAMAEALENHALQTFGFERGRDFLEGDLASTPALDIIGEVSIDAAAHPFGQLLPAGQAEGQRELRPVRKSERFF